MKDVILFPFDIEDNNKTAYVQAMKLADEQDAKIVMFTALHQKDYYQKIDQVYFHLLELNGYYQTFTNGWQDTPSVEMERKILKGDKNFLMEQVVAETQPKWIIE
ncbi:MAG: hypothetical protein AAF573_22635 [Bacteroidota bacterium]